MIRPNVWKPPAQIPRPCRSSAYRGHGRPGPGRVLNLFAVQSFTPERVRADKDHKIRRC
ncbi:hypothetical protein P4123_22600 [Pseudomonas aeruginosa]|nr:hypothetical protein [Pseudomonas aeruginosa]